MALMKLVVTAAPFHVIEVLLVKFDPLAVSVNAGPPAAALFGEMLVRLNCAPVAMKLSAFELRPTVCAVMDAVVG